MLRLWLVLALGLLAVPAAAESWRLDPETSVSVDVGWQGGTVEVKFPRIDGTIDFDERRPETARARITVSSRDAATGMGVVDALVRGRDYLDAQQYPEMIFELDRLARTSPQTADVFGRLTLRGHTEPVAFKARVLRYGPAPDAPERFEAGFDIEGVVDRTEFGSTAGLPEVPAALGVRIRLMMSST